MSLDEPKVVAHWRKVSHKHEELMGENPNPSLGNAGEIIVLGNVRAGEGLARHSWFAHLGNSYNPITKNGCADIASAKELVELFVLMPTTDQER